MSEEEIQKRIEEIRQERAAAAEAQKKRSDDFIIQMRDKGIHDSEQVDIRDLTDDNDIYQYVSYKLTAFYGVGSGSIKRFENSIRDYIILRIDEQTLVNIMNQCVTSYFVVALIKRIIAFKSSIDYIARERIRKEPILLAMKKKAEEDRIAKEKADEEERIRRLQDVNETNMNIRRFLSGDWSGGFITHTFTDVTIDDWNVNYMKPFLVITGEGVYPLIVDKQAKKCTFSNGSFYRRPEFVSEDYKDNVPFCTNCPTCSSPTKFSYLDMIHRGSRNELSHKARYVYCDNHYYYDFSKKMHYKLNPFGNPITYKELNLPDVGMWNFQCWMPINNKWTIWDPSDPDGSRAMAEKKKKEAEEIQRQISELQAKLAAL